MLYIYFLSQYFPHGVKTVENKGYYIVNTFDPCDAQIISTVIEIIKLYYIFLFMLNKSLENTLQKSNAPL